MSKRTAEASKAIKEKWEIERNLILEGKGTRQWTTQQQKDILEKGKAYDEKGRAFEGQHMQSVDKYPEYQGDSGNIQLLSRDEHFAAHDYNWQNPTNWEYNPVTKTKKDFGDGKYIPCKVIELENSVIKLSDNHTIDNDQQQLEKTVDDKMIEEDHLDKKPNKPKIKVEKKENFGEKIINVGVKAVNFVQKHPIITGIALQTADTLFRVAFSDNSKSKKATTHTTTEVTKSVSDGLNVVNNSLGQVVESIVERTPPSPNVVKAHKQRYNTRNGVIWKDKASYKRGG